MSGRIYDYTYLPIKDDNPFPVKGRLVDVNGNPITSANPLPVVLPNTSNVNIVQGGEQVNAIDPLSVMGLVNRTNNASNGVFPVTTSATELKVGASPIANRGALVLINDSTGTLLLSPDPAFAPAFTLTLYSGNGIQILLDPDVPRTYYIKHRYYATTCVLIEVGAV